MSDATYAVAIYGPTSAQHGRRVPPSDVDPDSWDQIVIEGTALELREIADMERARGRAGDLHMIRAIGEALT